MTSLLATAAGTTMTVQILRLGGMGDGIGEWAGKALFVAKTLPGDVAEIEITKSDANFSHARLIRLITPSPQRVEAPCPHFDLCGGCSLQHLQDADYAELKQKILQNALHHADAPLGVLQPLFRVPQMSRRRADFKFENGSLALLEAGSHRKVPISQCIILTPNLQALIAPLNAALKSEKALYNVQLTDCANGIDLSIASPAPLMPRSRDLLLELPGVIRIHINGKQVFEKERPIIRFGEHESALPPGAFLQASEAAQNHMVQTAQLHIKKSAQVLDLFSGLGAITLQLPQAIRVTAAELDIATVTQTQYTLRKAKITTRHAVRRDLYLQPFSKDELLKYDSVILNPPRAGADTQCRELAHSNIQTIIMISCHPGSFARDAKTLLAGGYVMEMAQGIDQFIFSPHVEIIAVFTRK